MAALPLREVAVSALSSWANCVAGNQGAESLTKERLEQIALQRGLQEYDYARNQFINVVQEEVLPAMCEAVNEALE